MVIGSLNIHQVNRIIGHYMGSESFMIDLAARLTAKDNMILISGNDIYISELFDNVRKAFVQLKKDPTSLGSITCVPKEAVQYQLEEMEDEMIRHQKRVIFICGYKSFEEFAEYMKRRDMTKPIYMDVITVNQLPRKWMHSIGSNRCISAYFRPDIPQAYSDVLRIIKSLWIEYDSEGQMYGLRDIFWDMHIPGVEFHNDITDAIQTAKPILQPEVYEWKRLKEKEIEEVASK